MNQDTSERNDPTYVQRKRRELLALRERLRAASQAAENEERAVRDEVNQEAHQFEDDAQKLDRLETEGEIVSRNVARLERIERALGKIEDGTYGLSDVSGQRIPEARLEAMPDAINTIEEQEAAESAAAADGAVRPRERRIS
jgi:DnaK suppressor protein